MSDKSKMDENELPNEEAERRAEKVLRRMLNTPPDPKKAKKAEPKRKKKPAK